MISTLPFTLQFNRNLKSEDWKDMDQVLQLQQLLKRFILMEHGQQEFQPGIPLGTTWSQLPEDLSQRDRLQRPYGNHKRLESCQEVNTTGGEGKWDKGESRHYSSYRGTADPDREFPDSLHGRATKMTVFIDNAQYPLIIYSGAHCSTVARDYLDNHFPNWENQLLPTKARKFKSASGKMIPIGTIVKEIIIPHRKGNIRLNPKFVVLDDAHIQGFLLGTNYRRMYGIDIYNSKNRHITIGTKKEKKSSLDIYQISAQDPIEELLNEFREGQLNTTLTSKEKLSLLKMLRKNRPAFAIGEEPLGKIRGHDIELYLDVERPYPPILRRPPYSAILETRKEIEKHNNELLDMDVIRKIGHNEIVEITTPVLITWNDGKSRLCGDFRALNKYTKSDRYPIPRITLALEKLAKARYITKMDCMKGFHQNGVEPNSMKLLRIICHMGIYEHARIPFGIKKAPAHFQRMMETIFQEEILEGWIVVYIDDNIIYSETWEDHVQYIYRVLTRKKNFRFSQWAPESGNTSSEGTETPILEISSSELHTEFFNDNKFVLIDGLLYHSKKHTSALIIVDRDHISFILQECHDCPYMGHMSEDRTKERVAITAWWPKLEQELSEYINPCERCQKGNRKYGKKYGLLQHIEEPKHPWETINIDCITGLVPGAFHPQTDGLAERMIQTMEDILRRFCAYGMEYKDHEGYNHDWVTLLPAVQLA
ncbi:hypothetical protein O181_008484 [Austropuccinia psidii MF-1]|uniref:Reverse transcriptase domain-containing protein n=1 Tax=Austropuccinia psidii MF-1 TaxID=1389203 RepID=A0A9Q3BNY3_9BASI|nr:hypothetical protein [Austropuccinia psidii MF-1]